MNNTVSPLNQSAPLAAVGLVEGAGAITRRDAAATIRVFKVV